MRKTMLGVCWILVLIHLAGCGIIQNLSEQKDIPVEKEKILFNWNEKNSNYTAHIPQLWIELIASPNKGIDIEVWKKQVKEDAEKHGIIVNKNTLETYNHWIRTINHFIVNTKEKHNSLQEQLYKDYNIKAWEYSLCSVQEYMPSENQGVYNSIQYPSDTNSIKTYRMLTLKDILWENRAIEEYWLLNAQTCWYDFPYQYGWFDRIVLNNILYDSKFPEKYIIYKQDLSHDREYSLYHNIEVVYL